MIKQTPTLPRVKTSTFSIILHEDKMLRLFAVASRTATTAPPETRRLTINCLARSNGKDHIPTAARLWQTIIVSIGVIRRKYLQHAVGQESRQVGCKFDESKSTVLPSLLEFLHLPSRCRTGKTNAIRSQMTNQITLKV
jgi:hypothetical protein